MDTNDLNLPRLPASPTPRSLRSRALLHSDETDRIIAAGIEVHRTLGPGFLEQIYEEALALELEARGIPSAKRPFEFVTAVSLSVSTG